MAIQGKRIINAVTLVEVGLAITGEREAATLVGTPRCFFCKEEDVYWFPVYFGDTGIGWCCQVCRERYRSEVRETAASMIREARG